ncbi:Hemin import ATP-binding protein HmuV [Marinomonas aquimarina]|uniref:Hemin import ATP-binding protein HmuV n=1 Tax=Marinomonas aquimarina TaxID=295068 RepID=A0A1A8T8D1_9GAMM|nr:ABC transporter ATP-binding protein [Marinomonas aquimarina]SBS27544.1 Hemin import ATP-binding protein HmuV [Marinomonas aquimarina]
MTLSTHSLVLDIPLREPHPLELAIESGQMWGILGPNGVGKTTLLHTLAGLVTPRSGSVSLAHKPLSDWHRLSLAQQVGVMFQEHQDGFPATVLETALLGRFPHLSPWEMETDADIAMARASLAYLELSALSERSVSQLSGGERQRTALAALLTQDPSVWLVDEPTNHLDLHHQVAVMRLLQRKAQSDKLVVMSLHDVNLAATWCSHVLLLYPDRPALMGRADKLLTLEHLQPLYQQPLVQGEIDGRLVFLPKPV